jgi:hypothetical protein
MKMRYFAQIGIQEDGTAMEKLGLEKIVSKLESSLGVDILYGGLYWDSGCTCLDAFPQRYNYDGKRYTLLMAKATKYIEDIERADSAEKFYAKFAAKMRKDFDELFGKKSGLAVAGLWVQTTC